VRAARTHHRTGVATSGNTLACSHTRSIRSGVVEWVRTWVYELRWRPDYHGDPVRSREVESIAQLREVVAWARRNPNVTGYSFRPVDHLDGDPAEVCRNGHRLMVWPAGGRNPSWLICAGCLGHRLAVCPQCGDRVIEPVPGPDCGPPSRTPLRRGPPLPGCEAPR